MLSLSELRRVLSVLDAERRGARLDKIVQSDPFELVLQLSGGADRPARDRLPLLVSCRPGFGRLSQLPGGRKSEGTPPSFTQYLRAHLEGGRLREARLRIEDRQAALRFETREGMRILLLQLIGPRSNLYLLDENERLLAHSRPLTETRRELRVGEPWSDPDSPPPPSGEDRFAEIEDSALLRGIEAHYADAEGQQRSDVVSRRVAQALKKQRAALERKLRSATQDAAAGEKVAELERHGELLKAHLKDVRPGASSVAAPDFETGEPVEIPLDPKLSAAKNLDLLFRRARKASKRAIKAAGEVDDLRARLGEIEALEADFEAAPGEEAVAALAERPELARMLARYFPAARETATAPKRTVWKIGKRELPTRLVPKRYQTRDGLEVWVGKNDEGNDLLTTRLARGKDLFFHLEGSPGSHVVLRTEGGEPPRESLLEASELAVHFSKQRNAGRAGVHVAAIKDVSKPSGAKPGLVYVHRGRTIDLRRDPERLRRILGARLED